MSNSNRQCAATTQQERTAARGEVALDSSYVSLTPRSLGGARPANSTRASRLEYNYFDDLGVGLAIFPASRRAAVQGTMTILLPCSSNSQAFLMSLRGSRTASMLKSPRFSMSHICAMPSALFLRVSGLFGAPNP